MNKAAHASAPATGNHPQELPLGDTRLRAALRRRLLALGYRAYLECLAGLLTSAGYRDVRPAGRRDWKGFNRAGGGGYDLQATLPGGLAPRPVVVQAKQFDALPVFQRSVDELRGACLRAGATEALLVTTSTFSPVVRRATAPEAVAPVRLLDGNGLLDLMLTHRVGVWEEAGETQDAPSRIAVDEAYFDALAAAFPPRSSERGLSRKAAAGDEPACSVPACSVPSWSVTVRIGPAAPTAAGKAPASGKAPAAGEKR